MTTPDAPPTPPDAAAGRFAPPPRRRPASTPRPGDYPGAGGTPPAQPVEAGPTPPAGPAERCSELDCPCHDDEDQDAYGEVGGYRPGVVL